METLEPPEKRRRTSKLDFAHLPNELLEAVLDHLDWFERWSLRVISTRFYAACTSSYAYHTIDLGLYLVDASDRHSPSTVSPYYNLSTLTTAIKQRILPHARTLIFTNHSTDFFRLAGLLRHTPFVHLTNLDLSFTRHLDEDVLNRIDAGVRMGIKSLAVRGCRRITNGLELAHLLPNLEHLDLSWSGLVRLPDGHFPTSFSDTLSDDFDDGATLMDLEEGDRSSDTLVDEDPSDTRPWAHLRTLRLNGCAHLSLSSLTDFLCDPDVLPPRLETLLMTCLEPSLLTPYILQHMAFVRPLAYTTSTLSLKIGDYEPNALRHIDVSWCDDVTREDVETLKALARTQRAWCLDAKYGQRLEDLTVVHTAVLESDTDVGYQRFIGLFTAVETVTD